MATGDRRLGSSARRGMTVLGKIPAVPKPINLPSQRLENRGLDPSVEIVPRGTFSWGTGRSPPTGGSSWGNVGLSSSPPVATGAWNTASTSAPVPSSNNNSGGGLAQNTPRPLSAGSTRPSSAGATRPLSASTTSGRAWGGVAKLEEQVQPSRFNLTTAEFPTLGSGKNPNLRPQQTPLNRPTSADATKERRLAYADHYQSGTSADRPTSADGSKERKPVYPGVPHADRPTSADGTHLDKGRHQSALRLPIRPPFADRTLPDQRHPFYTGVVGHGTAGPGPGNVDRPIDNYSNHPLPVQHGIITQGREFIFPQHDLFFNRPGGPHSNDVVVLPMDARPEVYGSYPFDSRPNHPDLSRAHHPQPSWGPNHLDRSGIHQGQFLQSDHFNIMQPQRRRMETAVLHEQPVAGHRRDGFGIGDKAFGEQRAGWAGTSVVFMGSSLDARESSIPMTGTGQEQPRSDMFLSSWGHQQKHAGWGNMYGGDVTMGMYQEVPAVIHKQATLIETMPGLIVEGVSEITILEANSDKGTAHADEAVHSSSLGAHQKAAASGNAPTHGQDMQYSKQEVSAAGPDNSRKRNNTCSAGTQPLKAKQEDEGTRVEQNREPQMIYSISSPEHFVANNSNIGCGIDANDTSSNKKSQSLQQSNKGMEEADSSAHEKEDKTASDGIAIQCIDLSSVDLLTTSGKERSNDSKEPCTDGQPKTSANDVKVTPPPNHVVPPLSEDEKAPLDDGLKTKRNGHSVRRAHHGRSMHDSHAVDRQHVNHGLVWAPKPMAVGATKEELQLPAGDAGDMHESLQKLSTDVVKKRPVQPSREHESQGESQVQQMQSAASSQQGQGQQVQEHCVVNSKRPVQHQKAERSSKKQGHRMHQQQTRSGVSEQPVQQEQSILMSCNNQSLHMKHQQSVVVELGQPQSQVEISQRETPVKQIFSTEAAENAGEVISTPVFDKFEGKKSKEEGNVYVRKPARNQPRQQREQEYEAVNNHHGQRFYSKGENSVAEDHENLVSETSANDLRKNQKEVKSRTSRNFKHQKEGFHESAASSGTGEWSGHRTQVDVRGEARVPSLDVEPKVIKDKEEKTHNQKLVRQQEMHTKQSATGSHQEYRDFGEELKGESGTIKNEKKLFAPKARKHYSQQECEAAAQQGHGRQGQTIQEVHSSNEKVQYDGQGSQVSSSHSNVRKNDIERYTPVQARQPYMQGQQIAVRGQRGQRTVDSTGGQAIRASSGHGGTEPSFRESSHISDSMGKCDEMKLSARGLRDVSKVQELSESGSIKKEVKHYVVKSGGQQQQSSSNADEEVPIKEEKWQRSHRMPGTESLKRKDEIKLYTVKGARQVETSVASEGKVSKEIGEPSLSDQQDPLRNGKEERTRELDHTHKNRNHVTKGLKSTPFYHSQKKTQPPLEDRNETEPTREDSVHLSRVDETNGSVKEHRRDQESRLHQKTGPRREISDNTESRSLEDAEVAKPRQYQRGHYQYQPVAQHLQTVKSQVEEPNAHKLNTRQEGHSRYERREGPRRGRGHGSGYRAAEHADSSEMR